MKTLARERDRNEILSRLSTVRAESQRQWGRMDAHQMICHLSDAFRLALGAKTARSVGGLQGLAFRTVLRWGAMYAPVRWPPGILTRPEIDQEIEGTRPVEFTADIAQLRALMQSFIDNSDQCPPHPLFGRMSRRTWLRWGYLHMDHHLRQFGA